MTFIPSIRACLTLVHDGGQPHAPPALFPGAHL